MHKLVNRNYFGICDFSGAYLIYTTFRELNLVGFSVVISGFELPLSASNVATGAFSIPEVVHRPLI